MPDSIIRCDWANSSPLMQEYHDNVWGVPCHDEHELFKMLILEGMQAGLSWSIILRKMGTLCEAFDGFDPKIVAAYGDAKIAQLLANPGIIRNRLKVNAAIQNAKAYFQLCDEYGSLANFLWAYVDGRPIINEWETIDQNPACTPLSDTISKDLKKMGFRFVGSTIIYAWIQAVGVVNDHILSCRFKHIG
jgi:DNA-3-methyladenine glycosylase I